MPVMRPHPKEDEEQVDIGDAHYGKDEDCLKRADNSATLECAVDDDLSEYSLEIQDVPRIR